MARAFVESSVAAPAVEFGGVVFELARAGDDAGIRRLLREQALGGRVRISLEREPSVRFAAGIEGERHHAVVARDRATGCVVGLGSRAVRRVWINGEPARMGYLGQLRRAPALEGRLQLLAAGFAELEKTRRPDELSYDLTSIIADNIAARRLLEYGLPGLPVYRPLGEFTTLMLAGRRRSGRWPAGVQRGYDELLPAIADCLQRNLRRYQFAPVWSVEDLRSAVRTRDLRPEDFFVVLDGSRVIACLARWDQRGFKQAVVRGYAPRLKRWRPVVNAALWLTRRPRLPNQGSALDFAYLSHVAVDGDRHDLLIDRIGAARAGSSSRGFDYLVIGLATNNPMLPAVRRSCSARTYPSILYLVIHERREDPLENLDGRIPQVEVATL